MHDSDIIEKYAKILQDDYDELSIDGLSEVERDKVLDEYIEKQVQKMNAMDERKDFEFEQDYETSTRKMDESTAELTRQSEQLKRWSAEMDTTSEALTKSSEALDRSSKEQEKRCNKQQDSHSEELVRLSKALEEWREAHTRDMEEFNKRLNGHKRLGEARDEWCEAHQRYMEEFAK